MLVADVPDPGALDKTAAELAGAGARVARRVWDDDPDAPAVQDPRRAEFANAVIDSLAESLQSAPGVLQRVMSSAASAAEDLNVEPFQGLVEILQNADDVSASEVRFAVRNHDGKQQLLIVHNGLPVTCHHVLPMTLPYLTTKTEDPLQKGRFGVGLKTLRRISTSLAVHCRPYHFKAESLALKRIEPEPPLPSFYDAVNDTMIILDLLPDFEREDLDRWFNRWDEDGLLFLNTVRRFRWCEVSGATLAEKTVSAGEWQVCAFQGEENLIGIRQRGVSFGNRGWTVFSADVPIAAGLGRAHKATGDTTTVSVAVGEQSAPGSGLFIAFRTHVPTDLPFALDGQFDPSTARDALIENPWNRWLIERCAEVLLRVAAGLLTTDPKAGWRLIPLEQEHVGAEIEGWPRTAFSDAFDRVRREIGERARLVIGGVEVALCDLAYEQESVAGLVGSSDIERLFPAKKAVPEEVRDRQNRWRNVLDQLGRSQTVGTAELLAGFSGFAFGDKAVEWWVEAGDRITQHHADAGEILGVPCWLGTAGQPTACHAKGSTSRPLVLGGVRSRFCEKWHLLDILHDAYGGERGAHALAWLRQHAAFSEGTDVEIELAAFAEAYARDPVEISDEDLRELRDSFDKIPDVRADSLGRRIGAALLLDGFTYKSRGRVGKKVSPLQAYLPRALDGDHPHWPDAADGVPGIDWLAASYEDKLRLGANRPLRKRPDGTVARGPRRFLMLLGAECAPRLVQLQRHVGTGAIRTKELRETSAEFVKLDYGSPDLDRILNALPRLSKRQRRSRSAALLRTLSRHWARVYAAKQTVIAVHAARVYEHERGKVTAVWLCRLREVAWVAVGDGQLVEAERAVIKSVQTQALYQDSEFACGVEEADVSAELAAALRLITEVRVSDLVAHLRQIRDAGKPFELAEVLAVYRTLASFCPDAISGYSRIGDLLAGDLRERFSDGLGLICIGPGQWRKPTELFSGKDVFHQPDRFVPAGAAYQSLWRALDVRKPDLSDCIRYCKELAGQPYARPVEAALIDVYRYMEALGPQAERRRLKELPLACGSRCTSDRPIYFVDDRELREGLAYALPLELFWTPPCDMRELPNLSKALGLTVLNPALTVAGDLQQALDSGESLRPRFQRGVDHLSNELARNDPSTREKLLITWDELRGLPLFIYDEPFTVIVNDTQLKMGLVHVAMRALLTARPRALHLVRGAIGPRDYGGRVVASLFSRDVQRRIEAEWSASWLASEEAPVEPMRFASDQEHAEALAELARKTESALPQRIKVTAPVRRTASAKPRLLKTFQGGIRDVTVLPGVPPKPAASKPPTPLATTPPPPSAGGASVPVTVPAYTNEDVQQRGWEVLTRVLNTTDAPELVDFRRRHGVGADGAIDWKTFVELKATGRAPQTSVEMQNTEYDRARERGLDFILALVSGLEEGERTEVRLILDPAHRATVRPIQGVRLVNLTDAPAVLVRLDNDEPDQK